MRDRQLRQANEGLAQARRIAVLTGAGISAESGVPTFRGANSGLLDVGMPMEQFLSRSNFRHNPVSVWVWLERLRQLVAVLAPNEGHRALSALERGRPGSLTVVTQNIDGLHERAGSERVLDIHGSMWRTCCEECGATYEERRVPLPCLPPACPTCSKPLRPDVVLYEEVPRHLDATFRAVVESEALLVVGTSALVYPAANLMPLARSAGLFVVEVNAETTPNSHLAHVQLTGSAGDLLPLLLGPDSAAQR